MRTDTNPMRLMPADYSPDMPIFENPGSGNILNAIPKTPVSYGPFASLQNFANALPSTCLGAFAAEDSSGNSYTFAGTNSDLYRYTGVAPANVSKSAAAYNVILNERWRYLQFGQRVLATDFNDPIQSYILSSSTAFSDLANGAITSLTLVAGSGYTNGTYALAVSNGGSGSGFSGTITVVGGVINSYSIANGGRGYPQTATIAVPAGAGSGTGGAITPTIATIAPKARYMASVRGFCVLGNTFDATSGAQTQRVWWSALNDPTNWPQPGTNTAAQFQSGYNDLFGDAGQVQGIVGGLGGCDGAVFMERAVYIMSYAGPPATFSFYPSEGTRGTPAPKSIVQIGGLVYYLGVDGFYVFDGSTSQTIGSNRVDKTFYAMLDQNNIHRIDGSFDPINKIVYWAFPSLSNVNGNPDTIIAYNWNLNKWSLIKQSCETIFTSFTFGYTLDNMPGGTLDQIQYPLDSRVWIGGTQQLSGFSTSHQLAYFNGSNLAATIDTAEKQPFPGQLAFVNNTRPLVDGGLPSVALAGRNILTQLSIFNAPSAQNATGTCPSFVNGRYIKAEFTMPAGSIWTHFQGVELDGLPNGVM